MIIEPGVTRIGNRAFFYCSSLTSVAIPDGVTSIGDWAFVSFSRLSRVAFLLMDESVAINYGDNVFSSSPAIYCYMFSPVDTWATKKGYNSVYLDEINVDSIRTITLPADFRLAVGESRTLNPDVFPADGAAITWTSSDPSVVRVKNGTVTAVNSGKATITATVGSVSRGVTIEVFAHATGFTLSQSEVWLVAKEPLQLSVVSWKPAGASADLTWTSSDENRAMVDQNGLVTTYAPGDVTITATTERGIARECLLHLCYPVTAVSLSVPYETVITGWATQLTAEVTMRTQSCVNHLVTFTSSDETVATVDAETGLVQTLAEGEVTLTATSASNKSDSVTLHVVNVCDPHTVVTDAAVLPTDDAAGLTEGRHCGACGEVLVPQRVVPPLGSLCFADFPAELTVIEAEAFAGTEFEALIIPDTVTAIGSRAFADCPSLLYVRIPAGVTVAADAFDGCAAAIDRAAD